MVAGHFFICVVLCVPVIKSSSSSSLLHVDVRVAVPRIASTSRRLLELSRSSTIAHHIEDIGERHVQSFLQIDDPRSWQYDCMSSTVSMLKNPLSDITNGLHVMSYTSFHFS